MDRSTILETIFEAIRVELEADGHPCPSALSGSTPLLGDRSLVDSLGLVSVIVALEQCLQDNHDVMITLVDDRAMSQRNSPFRTAGTLADYTLQLVRETNRVE